MASNIILYLGERSARQGRKFKTYRLWIMCKTKEWNRIAFTNIVRVSNICCTRTHIREQIFGYSIYITKIQLLFLDLE